MLRGSFCFRTLPSNSSLNIRRCLFPEFQILLHSFLFVPDGDLTQEEVILRNSLSVIYLKCGGHVRRAAEHMDDIYSKHVLVMKNRNTEFPSLIVYQ